MPTKQHQSKNDIKKNNIISRKKNEKEHQHKLLIEKTESVQLVVSCIKTINKGSS